LSIGDSDNSGFENSDSGDVISEDTDLSCKSGYINLLDDGVGEECLKWRSECETELLSSVCGLSCSCESTTGNGGQSGEHTERVHSR
ncbi:hypothetical protein PMAYCL1PPCAC_33364, partial [Pristionchus mayeri]